MYRERRVYKESIWLIIPPLSFSLYLRGCQLQGCHGPLVHRPMVFGNPSQLHHIHAYNANRFALPHIRDLRAAIESPVWPSYSLQTAREGREDMCPYTQFQRLPEDLSQASSPSRCAAEHAAKVFQMSGRQQ